MAFASTDKDKEALENYTKLWDEVKDQIKTISGDNPIEYGKYFIKAKFESNDDLPLGKILNIPVCIIVVKSVFIKFYFFCKFYYMNACMKIKSKSFLNQILLY